MKHVPSLVNFTTTISSFSLIPLSSFPLHPPPHITHRCNHVRASWQHLPVCRWRVPPWPAVGQAGRSLAGRQRAEGRGQEGGRGERGREERGRREGGGRREEGGGRKGTQNYNAVRKIYRSSGSGSGNSGNPQEPTRSPQEAIAAYRNTKEPMCMHPDHHHMHPGMVMLAWWAPLTALSESRMCLRAFATASKPRGLPVSTNTWPPDKTRQERRREDKRGGGVWQGGGVRGAEGH